MDILKSQGMISRAKNILSFHLLVRVIDFQVQQFCLHLIVGSLFPQILYAGINPKTNGIYILEDITNQEYKTAVENYILENTEGV